VTRSFTAATTVQAAVEALERGARPVAGGTDLVVGARQGKAPLPEALVGIDRVEGMRGIASTPSGMRLGALTTHAEIVESEVVRGAYAALADASAIVGSHATRANGTIGGNVMNASPAMDTGGPLLCFGAVVCLRSAAGERAIPIEELWTGPGSTAAGPSELLVAIELSLPAETATGSAYVRLEYRRQMEIAVVGATAVVSVDGGSVVDARVAITALAPTIRRVAEAERLLVGTGGDADAAAASARAAAAGSAPIGDVRASAAYRLAMAEVVARRAIDAAMSRARGHDVPVPASDALYGT
jgi:CO/xanthine dehydrogenase FAD-binding subunit